MEAYGKDLANLLAVVLRVSATFPRARERVVWSHPDWSGRMFSGAVTQ